MRSFHGFAFTAIGMMLLIAALSLSLSGCATAQGQASYDARYPLCTAVPSGVLGCR